MAARTAAKAAPDNRAARVHDVVAAARRGGVASDTTAIQRSAINPVGIEATSIGGGGGVGALSIGQNIPLIVYAAANLGGVAAASNNDGGDGRDKSRGDSFTFLH